MDKAVMTITEAAAYIGSTEKTVYSLAEQGHIPHRRQGRKLIFLQRDIDAWPSQLPGVSVQQAIHALNGGSDLKETPRTAAPTSPDITSPATPIVLVRRPAQPRAPRPSKALDR